MMSGDFRSTCVSLSLLLDKIEEVYMVRSLLAGLPYHMSKDSGPADDG